MRKLILSFLICITISAFPFQTKAAENGSFDFQFDVGGRDFANQVELNQYSGYDIDREYFEVPPLSIFLVLSESDGGQTYSVGSGDNFDHAVSFLTNGVNDWVYIEKMNYPDGGGGGTALREAAMFFDDPTGSSGIDFFGYNIDTISLTVDILTFESPGRDPNGDGIWTDIDRSYTLTVHDPVTPIPPIIWLLGSGLIAYVGIKKRKMFEK